MGWNGSRGRESSWRGLVSVRTRQEGRNPGGSGRLFLQTRDLIVASCVCRRPCASSSHASSSQIPGPGPHLETVPSPPLPSSVNESNDSESGDRGSGSDCHLRTVPVGKSLSLNFGFFHGKIELSLLPASHSM